MRLRSPVDRIAWGDDGVTPAGGAELSADACVVAVPPAVLRGVAFEPVLPAALEGVLRAVRYGAAAKLFVPLASPAPPSAVMYVPERYWTWTATGDRGELQPVVTSFSGSPTRSPVSRRAGPVRWIDSLGACGTTSTLDPGGAMLSTWTDDPWAGAAYSTSPPLELAELTARAHVPLASRRVRGRTVRGADGGRDPQREGGGAGAAERPLTVTLGIRIRSRRSRWVLASRETP